MTYDSSISRGDASAGMPENVMGKSKKKSKKTATTSHKAVETNTFRSMGKKKK